MNSIEGREPSLYEEKFISPKKEFDSIHHEESIMKVGYGVLE